MSSKIYPVPADFAALAHLRTADYQRLYQESVRDPHGFWGRIGRRIDWIQPFSKVKDTSYDERDFRIRWYYDGKLNVAANCLDRHLTKRGAKTAIIWEGDDPRLSERIPLKANVDSALGMPGTNCVKHVLVVRRMGSQISMVAGRDQWFDVALAAQPK